MLHIIVFVVAAAAVVVPSHSKVVTWEAMVKQVMPLVSDQNGES